MKISCQFFSGGVMAEPNHLAADPTPSRLIPEFPDEISEQCIARLPLSSHQELARVSRSWRIFINSQRIFKIRRQLLATEIFLCINVWTPINESFWYLLIRDHNGVPSCLVNLPPVHRQSAVVAAIRDRVYVVGDATILRTRGPRQSTLSPVSGSRSPVRLISELKKLALARGGGGFVFNPAGAQPWRALEFEWDMKGFATTVVDGYIYSNMAGLRGYHPERQIWMTVGGLPLELEDYFPDAVMTNLGGLLCLVWLGSQKEIQFSGIKFWGIKVWMTSSGGFRGSIKWSASTLSQFRDATLKGCVALEF